MQAPSLEGAHEILAAFIPKAMPKITAKWDELLSWAELMIHMTNDD